MTRDDAINKIYMAASDCANDYGYIPALFAGDVKKILIEFEKSIRSECAQHEVKRLLEG